MIAVKKLMQKKKIKVTMRETGIHIFEHKKLP